MRDVNRLRPQTSNLQPPDLVA